MLSVLRAVGQRAGWRCGLCGGVVEPSFRFDDPLSPSLFHTGAGNGGGGRAIRDLQLAHLWCNTDMPAHAPRHPDEMAQRLALRLSFGDWSIPCTPGWPGWDDYEGPLVYGYDQDLPSKRRHLKLPVGRWRRRYLLSRRLHVAAGCLGQPCLAIANFRAAPCGQHHTFDEALALNRAPLPSWLVERIGSRVVDPFDHVGGPVLATSHADR
jgi:hypothetical protein